MKIIISIIVSLMLALTLSSCSQEPKPDNSPSADAADNALMKEKSIPTKEEIEAPIDDEKNFYEIILRDPPYIIDREPPKKKWVENKPLSHKVRFSGILESHNKIRSKHKLPPLKWSDKLANYSREWAKNLSSGKRCKMYHRKHSPFGENLYRSSAIIWSDGRTEINPVTIKQVVKAWTDEEKWYDYQRNRCQPGQLCGHYTQVVWKDTTEVGCAMQVCADKSQSWVCSYNPPGNYVGVRPY